MKDVLLLSDDLCLAHDPGPGHPENAARLAQALADLARAPLPDVRRATPRDAERGELLAVHRAEHVDAVAVAAERAAWRTRQVQESAGDGVRGSAPRARSAVTETLDPDTAVSAHSFAAARRAAGAALAGVEAVCEGSARGAFALVRPPGHHAGAQAARGFCLFNNVALAAEHAVRRFGLRRVAILDPDVHHGNGTQESFASRADVLFASSHRYPFYPGTGFFDEVGQRAGAGHSCNLPLPMGLGDADFVATWERVIGPVLEDYRPELILVSAGFDTWHRDPVGDLRLTERGFRALWQLFRQWSEQHCPGRLVGVLEGGYDPAGVAAGVSAALAALAAPRAEDDELAALRDEPVSPDALAVIERARGTLSPFWRELREGRARG